ncbi:MAG: HNH endonuclease signature motif containing protein [Elusimicrobiota bacterium]
MDSVSGHTLLQIAQALRQPALALRSLSDESLLARLDELVRQERESSADIVEHLMEIERRETALDLGYSSLFEYCVKKLGYSEASAFLRIRAARACARFPDILARLRSGSIHLDAIARLYPHLTSNNSKKLLDRAAGATKRDVMALVATLQTEPVPMKDLIVAVPPPGPGPAMSEGPRLAASEGPQPTASSDARAAASPTEPAHAPEIIPPPLHRFHFTGDDELFSMITRLRGLLKHKHPGGRLEDIFKEAARILLEVMERKLQPGKAQTRRSRAGTAPEGRRNGSRSVPRAVKRAVWARDGGRCAYVAPDGRRCESRDALEYDHIVPWADGGRSDTADNIRLLCRAHNQRLGRRRFGPRTRGRRA